jgi:hypothetical protein
MKADPDRLSRWLGGVSLVVVCFLPPVLLAVAAPSSALTWNSGPWTFSYGGMLSALPGLASVLLLAPLVSYRRRDAFMMLIPGWNVYLAWLIGARAGELGARRGLVDNGHNAYPARPAQRA